MSPVEAHLTEVFGSIQGEGLYVGERQIFVRFAGCNLSCQYCDSPQALVLLPSFRYEKEPASRKFESLANPVGVERLAELVSQLDKPAGVNHSISLTGGEPLLQVDFLKAFIPAIKKIVKLPIYLETNGVLAGHLSEVIELIDIVALDIKLPSATGLTAYWKEHRQALETAGLKEVFVKIVITRETKISEIIEAAALISAVDEGIPLILQPVSPHGPVKHRPSPEELMACQAAAKRKLRNVRVIAQMHKVLGLV